MTRAKTPPIFLLASEPQPELLIRCPIVYTSMLDHPSFLLRRMMLLRVAAVTVPEGTRPIRFGSCGMRKVTCPGTRVSGSVLAWKLQGCTAFQ